MQSLPQIADFASEIHQVVKILSQANSLLFITGAGISAESGLPTYRGIGGLYEGVRTAEDLPIEVALSGEMMRNHPAITWKYILQIENACRACNFNRAHEIIAQMETHFHRVWVLTQNVDGFHRRSGSNNVIDIHGDIHDLQCTQCNYHTRVENYQGLSALPRCPECCCVIRPRVVLFGEMLETQKNKLMLEQFQCGFDLIFSIGTTSVFPYIAQPVLEASRWGAPTVEINPGETEVSHCVSFKFPFRAVELLSHLWDMVKKTKPPKKTKW